MSPTNLERAKTFLDSINGHKIRSTLSYDEFLELMATNPERVLRNVFQLFHDLISDYVGQGLCAETGETESMSDAHYDCTRLLVEGANYPFFADRFFARRLVKLAATMKRSAQQNMIYLFRGPPGSGKSTFLNNLLQKFEEFTGTEAGLTLRTVWRILPRELGLEEACQDNGLPPESPLEVPCPSFDHPILIIPKTYRLDFFRALFHNQDFLERLTSDKEYDWVWKDEPCTICSSLYQALLERVRETSRVFEMVVAQPYSYNRRRGEGINVFMPGDKPLKESSFQNDEIQKRINSVLRDSNRVRYVFSQYAKTNNGIYALMDIKSHNKTRLMDLHNIISEGVYKVEELEERVNSLFLGIMNPQDLDTFKEFESFEDRIEYIKIPYVMDHNTEVEIYRNIFGQQIEQRFLPRVLHNFARVIISTRLNPESPPLKEWIQDPRKYSQYCDPNLHLLKMEIYSDHLPKWLSEEDRKQFTPEVRRRVIAEGEIDGEKGISGRESIKIFNDFYSRYATNGKLINMSTLDRYVNSLQKDILELIPEGFMEALMSLYNYTVLQEVKESLYSYNEERISRDIQNYIFAVNFEPDSTETCTFTGENLEITTEFFESLEKRLLGPAVKYIDGLNFREETQKRYTTETLPREMIQDDQPLIETALYQELFERYVYNLKEKVLDPFLKNENFRRAIKDYAEDDFKTYDKRIQEEVTFLINNLMDNCGYDREGAQEVCIYVVDNDLAAQFESV